MALDVLSFPNTAPIIVGDGPDLSELESVRTNEEGRYYLTLAGQKVLLGQDASENFQVATHVLLVALGETTEIENARKVRIDNLADGRSLSPEECRDLAQALSFRPGEPREFSSEALAQFRRSHPVLAAA